MAITELQKRAPVFFVSHGAGPFAILQVPHQQPLVDLYKRTAWILDGCKGVICVTAHWLTDQLHISSAANPPIYCDYFDVPGDPLPKEAWEIEYPATGAHEIAHRNKENLDKYGFESVLDDERGWDHGVWTPMMLLRPQADLPIVQISIPQGDKIPERAIAWGKALEPNRRERN
jgi:aromatic ring-opening dioxygenase catalytic subunit (LigB family)